MNYKNTSHHVCSLNASYHVFHCWQLSLSECILCPWYVSQMQYLSSLDLKTEGKGVKSEFVNNYLPMTTAKQIKVAFIVVKLFQLSERYH